MSSIFNWNLGPISKYTFGGSPLCSAVWKFIKKGDSTAVKHKTSWLSSEGQKKKERIWYYWWLSKKQARKHYWHPIVSHGDVPIYQFHAIRVRHNYQRNTWIHVLYLKTS